MGSQVLLKIFSAPHARFLNLLNLVLCVFAQMDQRKRAQRAMQPRMANGAQADMNHSSDEDEEVREFKVIPSLDKVCMKVLRS